MLHQTINRGKGRGHSKNNSTSAQDHHKSVEPIDQEDYNDHKEGKTAITQSVVLMHRT